ncbi:MAG: NAD-binding protein [Nitrospirota bacterium]
MKRMVYWILGAGRFGRLAVERLLARREPPQLVVVDQNPDKLLLLADRPLERVNEDVLGFLRANLEEEPDWIVPAVPIHVAFVWLFAELAGVGQVEMLPVPITVDAQVPNPWRDGKGGLYTSVATFRCPDNCSEPRDRCTATGLRRSDDLFTLLARIRVPGSVPLVVRSHQLAAGVGGYRPSALRRLVRGVEEARGSVLVATACRCHGVIHALSFHGA